MDRLVTCPNGTVLAIDDAGDPSAPLVVELEGHMAQYISTPESYRDRLVEEGFRVVRVDNRDVGRSTRAAAPYTLDDMAEDVHGLLEVLDSPAVVCGRSMGGAIAQLLALAHPEDVLGLGLFFTYAKAEPASAPPDPSPAPFTDLESFAAWEQQSLPPIAGSRFPSSADEIDRLARHMWGRGVSWDGIERQRTAMATQAPWAGRLERLQERGLPVVIVHGDEDPVIPVAAADRLSGLLPGADLRIVEGMGHQQPPELDDLFADATRAAAREAR